MLSFPNERLTSVVSETNYNHGRLRLLLFTPPSPARGSYCKSNTPLMPWPTIAAVAGVVIAKKFGSPLVEGSGVRTVEKITEGG